MDLHAGNVIIRATKKRELRYGTTTLPLLGHYAMIMDLQKYCLQDPLRFVESLERVVYTACVSEDSDLVLDFVPLALRPWHTKHMSQFSSEEALTDLSEIIDRIPVRYVKSERPVMKW